MTHSHSPYDRERIEAINLAREAVETAIATLKTHQANITEGQLKDIKRIIYGRPEE